MNNDICVLQEKGQLWLLKDSDRIPVLATADAARLLGVSLRQMYRYIDDGTLESYGKLLGDWLIDKESVERLRNNRPSKQPLPARLSYLFPEYELQRLNAGRDSSLVISRVFESGTMSDLRWLFKRYDKKALVAMIERDGARLLSPKSRRLWSLVFGIREPVSWRSKSNPWSTREVV